MIELNLLPEELQKKRKTIELPDIPIIPIAAAFLGTMIIVQLFLGGLIFFNERRLATLEKKWTILEPEKLELDKLKKKILLASAKGRAIDELMEKRISWSQLLNEISNSLIRSIWLTELTYKRGAAGIESASRSTKKSPAKKSQKAKKIPTYIIATLTIAGSSSGKAEECTASIARFIKTLKGNAEFFKNFTDIELVSIKKDVVAGQDVMDFTLACKFKPIRIDD